MNTCREGEDLTLHTSNMSRVTEISFMLVTSCTGNRPVLRDILLANYMYRVPSYYIQMHMRFKEL